jgi:large subunit ribosomal protein L3
MKGLIGKKVGMTQVYDEKGAAVPVTVILAGPCYVTQVRTSESNGYSAVQLGFEELNAKNLAGGELGHLTRNGLPPLRHLREFRLKKIDVAMGEKVTVDVFSVGDHVDVVGTSKGKGFAGAMKRHNFNGAQMTHGQSDRQRSPGSHGAGTAPGHVFKGSRGPGHMGDQRTTAQNLKIVVVDAERNLIAVRGAIPGPKGGLVMINEARKQ